MNYDYKNLAKAIRDKGLNHLGGSKATNSKPKSSLYKLVPQSGICTVVVDKLYIREKPSVNSSVVE